MAKFHAESKTLHSLFQGLTSFSVPRFQRGYAWGAEEIEELLRDLFDDVELCEEIDVQKGVVPASHFVGAVVLASSRDSGSNRDVLDGQQRLVTLTSILALLGILIGEEGPNKESQHVSSLLTTDFLGAKEVNPKLRLQEADAEVYKWLLGGMIGDLPRAMKRLALAKSVYRLRERLELRITELLEECGRSATRALIIKNMISRVAHTVELVSIVAESVEDAYAIFETLNDRGLALTAADLIKNKILSLSGPSFADVADEWDGIVATAGREGIVDFLRHYWLAAKGLVRKRDLYRRYQEHLDSMSVGVLPQFLGELRAAAEYYGKVVSPIVDDDWPQGWDEGLAETLRNLNDLKIRSCRPLLLAVSASGRDVSIAARFAEAVAVRYVVVGEGNTSRLERGFLDACELLREEVDLVSALKQAFGDLMPSDVEFTRRLHETRMDRQDSAWRRILIELERSISGDEVVVNGPKHVHIEHVLPLEPRERDLAVEWGLATREEHGEWVGSLGNLTLLSGKLNRRAANQPYSAKRLLYSESKIQLNDYFANVESWGPAAIRDRTDRLAAIAREVWPQWPPE